MIDKRAKLINEMSRILKETGEFPKLDRIGLTVDIHNLEHVTFYSKDYETPFGSVTINNMTDFGLIKIIIDVCDGWRDTQKNEKE